MFVSSLALYLSLRSVPVLQQADSKVPFIRTFTAGEIERYSLEFDRAGAGPHFKTRIKSSVLAPPVGTSPASLSLETSEYEVIKGSGGSPATIKVESTRHNLMSGLSMDGKDYVITLFTFAGFTPDKPIKEGDTFVVEWKSSKGDVKAHGRGEIEVVNLKKMTVGTHLKISFTIDKNLPLGTAEFHSVSDLTTGALKRSEGEFGVPKLKYKIKISTDLGA